MYQPFIVTLSDDDGPVYCSIHYGYTNYHWSNDENDLVYPTIPSASHLLILCNNKTDGPESL